MEIELFFLYENRVKHSASLLRRLSSEGGTRRMSEPPSGKRVQVHLSTALLLMVSFTRWSA